MLSSSSHADYETSSSGIHPISMTILGQGMGEYSCPPPNGMTRLSIFLCLPYWHTLKVNHLLDPMHIFKNVASILWEHLLGKRDTLGAREDMKHTNQLPETWPKEGKNGKMILPKAPWILTNEEIKRVQGVIASIRTPTGCMRSLKGAFSKPTKKGKTNIYGLKTHDWHKMLQVSSTHVYHIVYYVHALLN